MNNLATVQNINNNSAYTVIYNFMEKKKKSKNTYIAYQRYYNEFFNFLLKGRDLWSVTWEDVLSINYTMVESYQNYMLNEKKWSENTCNQKLFAIKALWDVLHRHNNQVDLDVLNFEELESEDNSYASLTGDEIELLFEFAENREYKGKTQRMFFEFLYTFASRKNVPMTLTWKQFTKGVDFKANVTLWTVNYYDKGKSISKSVNDDFYNRLLEIKEDGVDKVFNVSHVTLTETFEAFRAKYNLYERNGKKITMHSIKKAAGWLAQNTFKDLNKTMKFLQHANPTTSAKIYINGDDDYTEQVNYIIGKDYNIDMFRGLGEETLLKLIERCGKSTMIQMWYELEKMSRE